MKASHSYQAKNRREQTIDALEKIKHDPILISKIAPGLMKTVMKLEREYQHITNPISSWKPYAIKQLRKYIQ